MPPLTPSRKRLSLCEKQKIIEDSKKPGFDKNKTCEKYGIGKSTLNKIMLTQKDILGFIDKGTLSRNHESSQSSGKVFCAKKVRRNTNTIKNNRLF